MKKNDQLWNNINSLLSYMRASNIRGLVDSYYLKIYKNSAPGELLQMEMDELQKRLDEAE